MISPEVKSIDWCDEYFEGVDGPALLALTATIGETGIDGGNDFQVIACNPLWIAKYIDEQGDFWPRGMLIVKKIDPQHIRLSIQSLANQFCQSESWDVFSERLNRYLLWEYEDYNDGQGDPIVPRLK